jgi:hypothetical protein
MSERNEQASREVEGGQTGRAFAASREDRDRTLEAIHRLELAMRTAAPGREEDWREKVAGDLRALEEAVSIEYHESLRPNSLLSMIRSDYARRFGSRVRQLREQQAGIGQQIASLRNQLDELKDEEVDFGDLRQRVGWLVLAIQHSRARETDLVFEALDLDLERGPE